MFFGSFIEADGAWPQPIQTSILQKRIAQARAFQGPIVFQNLIPNATRSVADVAKRTPFTCDVILLETGAVPTVFGLTNENLL